MLPGLSCAPFDDDCANRIEESIRHLSDDDISTLILEYMDVSRVEPLNKLAI